jgi:uncharacterized protein
MKPFEEVYNCDSITINVTNKCNLNCKYCFEHSKNAGIMDSKTAIDILDKSYKDIPKAIGTFTVNIFGGEPLLNWNCIKDLIDYSNEKKYNVKFGITTNLTILTDEMIRYFDDNEVMLLVSIDGLKKVHDKNRCNSYDIVKNNINKLIRKNLALFIEARMTILPEDIDYAFDGVKELIDMGINNICPMMVTDVEWDDEHISKLRDHYYKLLDYYASILNDRRIKRNISIKNTDDVMVNVMSPDIDDPIMCPVGGTRWCAFDTNGDVYSCHQGPTSEEPFKSALKLGNIYTGINDALISYSPIYARYDKKECKSCFGKSICKGGCPTENMRLTGVIDQPTDSYCKIQNSLVDAVLAFDDKIISAKNIRNRRLNILIENIKIRNYTNIIFNSTDLSNKVETYVRISHLKEMIENLGYANMLPTFKQYVDDKLSVITAYLMEEAHMSLEDVNKKLKETSNNG